MSGVWKRGTVEMVGHPRTKGRATGENKPRPKPPRHTSTLPVCVRHEGIARSVLLFPKEVTTPAVLPAVPYRGVRRRRRRGAKPSGQRILTREGGDRSASRDRDCQHRGGRGPEGLDPIAAKIHANWTVTVS